VQKEKKKLTGRRPVRLAYQPPASITFLSEQTSHQQTANCIFLSKVISVAKPTH
jgi:hypothetical protein